MFRLQSPLRVLRRPPPTPRQPPAARCTRQGRRRRRGHISRQRIDGQMCDVQLHAAFFAGRKWNVSMSARTRHGRALQGVVAESETKRWSVLFWKRNFIRGKSKQRSEGNSLQRLLQRVREEFLFANSPSLSPQAEDWQTGDVKQTGDVTVLDLFSLFRCFPEFGSAERSPAEMVQAGVHLRHLQLQVHAGRTGKSSCSSKLKWFNWKLSSVNEQVLAVVHYCSDESTLKLKFFI